MTLSVGPNLGLLVNGALGEEHYDELMAMWRGLDVLVQSRVISTALSTPPGSPADGDAYIVAASPTGDWVGHAAKIARWSTVVTAWEFFAPKSGWTVHNAADSTEYKFDGTSWVAATASAPTTAIPIAVSDESTALTTGPAKVTFRMPFGFTLTGLRGSLTTAPTGSVLTVDINEGGTSILSTKLTIDAGEKTSVTAATAPVISDSTLADDAEITIDIDTVGSTVAGAGLKVYLIGTVA